MAEASRPRLEAPAGATDCHMHIYEPGYAMAPTALTPPQPNAMLADYRAVQARLGLQRVVIVQPSTYGLDNRCTLDALARAGASARAVICVDPSVGDDQLAALRERGVRGIRFFVLAGGAIGWDVFDRMAARAIALRLHVQVQFDGREMPERSAQLAPFAEHLVIDHLGRFTEPVAPDSAPFNALLTLVDAGAWVKLSAPYESGTAGPPWRDIGRLAKELVRRAPDRMVWATNWPHPNTAPRPDDAPLLDMLLDWVADEAARGRILAGNPARLYGF